jgi:hypothetical protein
MVVTPLKTSQKPVGVTATPWLTAAAPIIVQGSKTAYPPPWGFAPDSPRWGMTGVLNLAWVRPIRRGRGSQC